MPRIGRKMNTGMNRKISGCAALEALLLVIVLVALPLSLLLYCGETVRDVAFRVAEWLLD